MMRLAPINDIWVYLAASPLLGLTITLLAYVLALAVHQRYRRHPLTNPVLLAVVLLVTLLLLTDTPYPSYFAGAQFVHFLLGPATVALAIPLYAQLGRVRAMRWPVLLGLAAGAGGIAPIALHRLAPARKQSRQQQRRDNAVEPHGQRGKGPRFFADLQGACGAYAVRRDAQRKALDGMVLHA